MASNFKHPGDVLDLTAPAGGVESGMGYIIGDIFVVATVDADADDEFQGQATGVWELPKTSAQAWTEGQPIFWNNTLKVATTVSTLGPLIGVASKAAANPSAVGWVRLHAAGGAGAVGGGGGGVVSEDSPTPTSLATAGAVALTAAQVLSGILVVDCAGAGRTYTFPDADDVVAAVPGAEVGDLIKLYIVNGSDAAETITLAAGTGGGFDTNQTAASRVIPQNTSKLVHLRLTNVTAAAEAYVLYA